METMITAAELKALAVKTVEEAGYTLVKDYPNIGTVYSKGDNRIDIIPDNGMRSSSIVFLPYVHVHINGNIKIVNNAEDMERIKHLL